MTCLGNLDVVILAGGLGTRLQPLLPNVPKVLAPIAGRPFLDYLVQQVWAFGGRRIILSLGHRSDLVEDYLRQRNFPEVELVTVVEPAPLGTGGGLRHAAQAVTSAACLVLNGDSYTRVNLCDLVAFHRSRPSRLSMLLTYLESVGRFGVVTTNPAGEVLAFQEKPDNTSGGYINSGVYLMESTVISSIPADTVVSLEREVFPRMLHHGLYAMKGNYPFIDIGTPESYQTSCQFFAEQVHDN